MVDSAAVLICASSALKERGLAVRFTACIDGQARPAFVVRYRQQAYGWINACRHQPLQLDWIDGKVFDQDGEYLVCSTHGARYYPDSGVCVAGPCRGARLIALAVHENDAGVYYLPDTHPPSADIT